MVEELLYEHISVSCPHIHKSRLQSVFDVSTGLQKSKNLSLTAIGREISGETSIKHRVKKVDRLLGNHHLYKELTSIYKGLSSYTLKYINQTQHLPLIVDLCYMKDTHAVQMLSAELALKGRSLPIYREVFEKNQLKGRASSFIERLSSCIPEGKEVLIIMDAGFGDDWFDAIDSKGWYWLVRARGKKFIKLSDSDEWVDARNLYQLGSSRAKHYSNAKITKKEPRECRIVIKGLTANSATRQRPKKLPGYYNAGNGNYKRSAEEPWVLATNLPKTYTASHIINSYKKRMQIEESFRDVKSHQFGLSARYIRTVSIYRWAVAMLLAAIVQVTLWIIGVIGHHQGMQSYFQVNTVKDKKIFSYFYLGQLIVEYKQLESVMKKCNNVMQVIKEELGRKW
jgi:hypothetical protein